jgi:hypothetical protein
MEHPHLRVEMDLQEYTVVVQTIEVVLEAVVQALQEMEAMQAQQLVGLEVVVLEVRVQMELFNLLEAVISERMETMVLLLVGEEAVHADTIEVVIIARTEQIQVVMVPEVK